MIGKIVYWNQPKGFGFVQESGIQYFFHHSNFSKSDVPVVGAYAYFNLGQSIRPDKPMQAVGVRFATAEEILNVKNLNVQTGADALKAGV